MLISLGALAGSARAFNYTVRQLTDPDNTACPSTTASCSLRQIINQVNLHPFAPDIISVPAGTYTLTAGLGALLITQKMSVLGAGPRSTVVAMPVPANRSALGDRVFNVTGTPTVTISGLKITGGDAIPGNGFFGGDVKSSGDLTLTNDWITNGSAYSGGGIANTGGTLTLQRSLVSNNSAGFGGGDSGGIENFEVPAVGATPSIPAHLIVDNSTIANNDARLVGGIFSWSSDPTNPQHNTLSITNSTIAGNSSQDEPGGAVRTTVGGLAVSDGTENIQNTILAGNVSITGNLTAPPGATTLSNCQPAAGGIHSLGHNIDSGFDCNFTDTSDHVNTNPLLGPLQNNGGPTDTFALAANSPALDSGPAPGAGCPSTDQRGVLRPQGAGCDIGAYELLLPPNASTQAATSVTESTAVLHGVVARNGNVINTTFQYAKASNLSGAKSTPTQTVSGLGPAGLSAILTGLPAKTRFYYRAVATDTLTGTNAFGAILSFTTTAPPSRIDSTMTWVFDTHKTYAIIKSLLVHAVPIGASVKVSCQGSACPYRSHTVNARKPKPRKHHRPPKTVNLDLTAPFRGRHLPYATQVTIQIVKSGFVGKVYQFKLKQGIQPRIGCLAPGGSQPGKNC
jgi:hypothetical protein